MNPVKAFTTYIRSCIEEAKKVSWPTRKDTIRFSSLVVGVSLLVAVFFGAIDAGFTKLVSVTLTSRQQQNAAPTTPVETQPVVPTVETAPGSAQPTIDLNAQPIVTPTEGATQ